MVTARSHWTTCFVVASAWVLALSIVLPTPAGANSGLAFAEVDFVGHINEQRVQAGLRPLTIDATMTASAAAWTSHMVDHSTLGHADPDDVLASIPGDPVKGGENVGRGQSVDSLFAAFMQSSAHRNNILDPAFTHIGVAVERHPWSGRLYTTHRFASLPPALAEPTEDVPDTLVSPAVVEPPIVIVDPPSSISTTLRREALMWSRGSRRGQAHEAEAAVEVARGERRTG